jgi:hypothetical protein
MNITEHIKDYSINNIFFLEPIKNTVIDNSYFIRILYSNAIFTLNGLYLNVTFNNVSLLNNNNKVKYNIKVANNVEIINFIKQLECDLLDKIKLEKRKIYKITEQLQSGVIKIINNNYNSVTALDYNNYVLKISGLWETPTEYGLTYKFINITKKINNGCC